MQASSTYLRGVIAGAIGALALAAWFLVVDLVRGAPLQTPAFLARTVFGSDSTVAVAAYTVLHIALWGAVGAATAWVLARIRAAPHFLLGAVLGVLLFDVAFYSGVVLAGTNIVRALGWPEVLAGNVIAGIALMGYLQATAPAGTPAWRDTFTRNRVVREGIVAGMVGAVTVAVWFLVLDAVQGRPLYTPAALGSAILLGTTSPADVQTSLGIVAAYTALHISAFIALGLVAAVLIGRAEKHPHVLLGAALLFVTVETFAIGLIAAAAAWLLDVMPWWTIAVANALAALVMGAYLWRAHPALHTQLSRNIEEQAALHTNGGA